MSENDVVRLPEVIVFAVQMEAGNQQLRKWQKLGENISMQMI